MLKRQKLESLTVAEVAKAIKWPSSRWAGNCYGIASQMVNKGVVIGKVRFGFWTGKIHHKSKFAGRLLTHHAWIELPGGRVLDPTRFAFENKEPYLFIGEYPEHPEYELGGAIIRMMRGEFPAFNSEEEHFQFPKALRETLGSLLEKEIPKIVSFGQVFWMAHLTPEELGVELCRELFKWLDTKKFRALIPIDMWLLVMGGETGEDH